MKEIPNLTFQLKDGAENHTTVSLLRFCLTQTPAGGFDFATIRARNRVDAVLEKVPKTEGGLIALEDADHVVAVQVVQATRWGSAHKDLIKFGEQFGL